MHSPSEVFETFAGLDLCRIERVIASFPINLMIFNLSIFIYLFAHEFAYLLFSIELKSIL